MQRSLTKGLISSSILLFALPLMLGNLLQQMYNIADTWVVGRFLGADALAALGTTCKRSAKKANSTKTETRNLLEPLGSEQVPGFVQYLCRKLLCSKGAGDSKIQITA